MKNKSYLLWVIIFFIFLSDKAAALDFQELPPFLKGERVLIFAPHPDDETIGTGGLIQRALSAGARVKVVCYTNGDHNELAFIVYEKRITFKKRELVHMGEVRQKETIEAMTSLGLKENDITFLGYPDFGTMEILTKYWGEKTKPFRNLLNRVSRVPYRNAYSYDAPYVGESILSDIESIVYDFKPTKIFVSHPADTNRDHRALYLFLQVALWDLKDKIKPPETFPYIIHVVGWPTPRGYHPDLELEPPNKLSGLWWKLPLSEEEIKAKHNAISFYKSQIKYNPPYLFTFARKNELFGDYPLVKLKAQNTKEISWQHLEIKEDARENEQGQISTLAYALSDNQFLISLTLKRRIDEKFGISIFLLGYHNKRDFSQMPKIKLIVDMAGLRVKEKKRMLFIKDAKMHFEGKALVISIPLSTLGNPHYILSCTRAGLRDSTLDDTAWHILYLE